MGHARYWKVAAVLRELFRFICVSVAAAVMAWNINNFMHVGGLLSGGFTGLSLLAQKIFETYAGIKIPFSIINIPLNAVPAFISYHYIGKKFTIYSAWVIVLTGILTDLMPRTGVTHDILLCAVFGGIINGAAVSLCLIVGATSGGTDFVSIFIAEHFGKDAWNYILAFNVMVLCISGFLFGWSGAMYSIILQYASTMVIQTIYKRYQRQTLLVITEKTEEVYQKIKECSNHDATLFKGIGMYKGQERCMLYSVISSDELRQTITEIKQADPHAFINIIRSNQLMGNFYKKPNC